MIARVLRLRSGDSLTLFDGAGAEASLRAGTAVAGQYANVGTATGTPTAGPDVTATDPSHYFGEAGASIDIEKLTNGEDADTAPGPKVEPDATVTWTYIVKNTGEVALRQGCDSDATHREAASQVPTWFGLVRTASD